MLLNGKMRTKSAGSLVPIHIALVHSFTPNSFFIADYLRIIAFTDVIPCIIDSIMDGKMGTGSFMFVCF